MSLENFKYNLLQKDWIFLVSLACALSILFILLCLAFTLTTQIRAPLWLKTLCGKGKLSLSCGCTSIRNDLEMTPFLSDSETDTDEEFSVRQPFLPHQLTKQKCGKCQCSMKDDEKGC